MKTPRPFRWMESVSTEDRSKRRHAYPAELVIAQGDAMVAICGQRTTIREHDHNRETPFPTCMTCDRVWRDVEGMRPPLQDHALSAR